MAISLPSLSVAEKIVGEFEAGRRHVDVAGPWGSAKTLIAVQAAAARGGGLLIVAPGRIEAEGIFDDLATFAPVERCAMFPAWEVLPTDAMAPADDIVAERMHTLNALARAKQDGRPMYVVCPVRALMQTVVDPKRFDRDRITLRVGDEQPIEDLVDRLTGLGYAREVMVEARGQLSVRGGILDVFPISGELPYRIEYFGDEIESIRRFEPETQRSIEPVNEVHLLPRSERSLLAESQQAGHLAVLSEYLAADSLVVFDEPMGIREESEKLEARLGSGPYFVTLDAALKGVADAPRLALAQVGQDTPRDAVRLRAPIGSLSGWERQSDGFWKQLQEWDADGYTVSLLCNNTGERQRLFELLGEHGYDLSRDRFDLRVELGRLRAGFVSVEDKLAVLSDREMFGRHYVRRTRRRFEAGTAVTAFSDLRAGDYIVHQEHGIGRYQGLRRFSGKAGDYMAIAYTGGDTLYVPVTHIDMVQKYTGGDGGAPKVDKIGGASWARKKARVKKALRDMTDELIKLYAARESLQGHAYSADTHWQQEFEDEFPYEETPDQTRAILEVKRDMEQAKPMDRLVCGDVGYGKTEVAIRAAFKAVMDGKQVAVLVPTTVLAEQHYETFAERLADFPVEVAMLSRFRTPQQIRKSIERMKSGEVDIAIGTHRLLSKDIQFKNLGLVIIDEEQRFGVAHKEKLKQMRQLVDVLTLTATPIPRTLNLALLGVRDMSVINTAPNDRLPVHTLIEGFDEGLIQEAIERELAREGQVFFLHNRVQTITAMADLVRRLVPSARIGIGHGQMHEKDLEHVMAGFVRKEIDVLVCTTIIGSGIDIPNANTIIINNADHFGLSELYQLRGRVGRYKHRAFAYLLVPGDRALSEDAQKRLKALEEFSTLGSGFRIAMRDLEIRGCGNILGGEQSGQIAAVGFDAYTHLLQEAVAELRGEPIKSYNLPQFDLAIDAFIPEEYVASETQKITLYKRISGVRSREEVAELNEELADRFGPPPAPVRRLLHVMEVRALGAEAGAKKLAATKDGVAVELSNGHLMDRANQAALNQRFAGRVEFSWKESPAIRLRGAYATPDALLGAAEELLAALAEL